MAIVEIINVAMKLWCEMKLNYMRNVLERIFFAEFIVRHERFISKCSLIYFLPTHSLELMTHHHKRFLTFQPEIFDKNIDSLCMQKLPRLNEWIMNEWEKDFGFRPKNLWSKSLDAWNNLRILALYCVFTDCHHKKKCFQTEIYFDNRIIRKDLYTSSLRLIVGITHSSHTQFNYRADIPLGMPMMMMAFYLNISSSMIFW